MFIMVKTIKKANNNRVPFLLYAVTDEYTPKNILFVWKYTHKRQSIVYTFNMDTNTPQSAGSLPEVKTTETVMYVHGRRIVIILIVVLLFLGVLGVLYYNGKLVYENGI